MSGGERRLHNAGIRALVATVTLSGLGLFALTTGEQALRIPWTSTTLAPALFFAGLLIIGELRPLVVAREDGETDTVTVSTTFAVALVLSGPLFVAMLAQGLAVAYDDLWRRRMFVPGLFNIGQYLITLAATRGVFCLASGHGYFDPTTVLAPHDILPALLAGLAFFAANNGTVALVVGLESGASALSILRSDIVVQGLATTILLGLAPVTAIAAHFSLLTLPLVVLPLVGVQHSAYLAASRQHEALHDGLTGLPNRTLLHRRARRSIEAVMDADASGAQVAAVLLLDLDHFKEVNDTLGHHVGDGLLQEVARRIVAVCPKGVTVGRLGGDEFAVLVPPGVPTGGLEVAKAISTALREPAVVEGVRIAVLASIGVAFAPEHADSVETLFQRADIALYRAKEARGAVEVYREEIDTHSVQRLSLLADLHAAAERDQLFLNFQPIVQAHDGRVTSIEALLRWRHPAHGTVSPDEFIPLAEGAGIISVMSRRAIDLALIRTAAIQAQGFDISVAVNLSARLLSDLELPDVIAAALLEHGVPGPRLTVEVTESTIAADPKRAMAILQSLRDMGVRIAVDDFGTGYSSLSYLSRLRPDELKVDKSFVTNLLTQEHSRVIVRSTVELGHALGMSVVAEGVEDEQTYAALVELGCDRIQGYVVARPMPGEDLLGWLDQAGRTVRGRDGHRSPGVGGVPGVPEQGGRAVAAHNWEGFS